MNRPTELPEQFRLIDLNDLPRYSPWPARLLGLSQWTARRRDEQLVLAEYGEKWGGLLDVFPKESFEDLSEAVQFLSRTHFPETLLFHSGERIYHSEANCIFWDFFYGSIWKVLRRYVTPDDTLSELGCGWGRNLFFAVDAGICRNAIGGEYTTEGVRLGTALAERFVAPVEFQRFDYYKPDQKLFDKLKGTVVFTHNSVEQIPSMPEETISALAAAEPKAVVHFEPVFEYRQGENLLHFLWRRYTEVNGYNTNLLTVLRRLQEQGELTITMESVHELGLNAFNPGSFVVWKPRRGGDSMEGSGAACGVSL